MKKQRFPLVFLSIVIVMTLFLVSCGAPASPTAAPVATDEGATEPVPTEAVATGAAVGEAVTISFWHGYTEDTGQIALLQDVLIPQFEAAHPNIKVEALQVAYNDLRSKLLTALAGGTAPDLMRSDIIWVPEYGAMGALEALDELMPDFQQYADSVFPGPLQTNFDNGHYWGLPLDTNNRVLVTNKAMFDAAGISAPPTTIDEFLAACEKIKALGEGKYCFADGGTYAWAVNPWIWSFGGDVTDPTFTTATGYLNGSKTKAAYEFLKNLLDQGYMHPAIKGGSGNVGVDTWAAFGNDEIAMLLEGPWFPPVFANKAFQMSLMPAGPGGPVSVVGGEDIVMFKQSQHKQEAAEFIRFLLSEESQVALSKVGQMPVLKSLMDPASPIDHELYDIFLKQAQTAKARTPSPHFTEMESIYTLAGGLYLRGDKSFDDAFNQAVDEINALLAP
jgi:multiple sugar transport system substrate-binding protein